MPLVWSRKEHSQVLILPRFAQAPGWGGKWLYKSAEQNCSRGHRSYSCVHGHWVRDSAKAWQLLCITYERPPAPRGNKYVCLKTTTLQWITFRETEDQHEPLNSLLKILYLFFFFFKTIKAKLYFKLTVFTFYLKGWLFFFFFLKHIGSYQSLYKQYEFNLLFLKETEKKNQNVKKEEKCLVQVFSS